MNSRNKEKGFTLVEIMLVVVIISIIAAIAMPAYNNHVKETRRTAAKATLLEMANAAEQHNSRTGTYNGITTSDILPENALTEHYAFTITLTAAGYTILAVPVPDSAQEGTGILQVNAQGERSWE